MGKFKNIAIGIVLLFGGCSAIALITDEPGAQKAEQTKVGQARVEAIGSQSTSENSQPVTEDDLIKIGSYGEAGKRAISIHGSEYLPDGISDEFGFSDVPGPIVWLNVSFKNVDNKTGSFTFSNFILIDSQGRKYNEINDLGYSMARQERGAGSRSDEYYPGEERPEAIAFRVAPDAKLSHLEWKGLEFEVPSEVQ